MHTDSREIHNPDDAPLEVWVEPWAFSVMIPPGESVRFLADSAVEGHFEIDKQNGGTCLYGWPGSNLKVLLRDETIYETRELRVPAVSNGMNVKAWVDLLFRGKPT